jgi:hypothetical protein
LIGDPVVLITTSDLKPEDLKTIEDRAGKPAAIAGDGLARYIGEAAVSRYAPEITAMTPDPLQPIYIKELRS